MAFSVIKIIDGNTIQVSPNWKWKEASGDYVKIEGYSKPSLAYEELAITKLNTLIANQQVELNNPKEVSGNVITCSVYLNRIDITQYFPELKTVK
jgi:endonuclease YncB( thermonuclease family)